MATLSVRSLAAYLAREPPLSIKHDVFGYIHGPIDRRLSLKTRAFGAVIGKALDGLGSGRGLVPTLVALQ